MLDALPPIEKTLWFAGAASVVLLALSGFRAVRRGGTAAVGEGLWTAVALALLAAVTLVVELGRHHAR